MQTNYETIIREAFEGIPGSSVHGSTTSDRTVYVVTSPDTDFKAIVSLSALETHNVPDLAGLIRERATRTAAMMRASLQAA